MKLKNLLEVINLNNTLGSLRLIVADVRNNETREQYPQVVTMRIGADNRESFIRFAKEEIDRIETKLIGMGVDPNTETVRIM